jgi:phospholipase/carboxylesterase
VQSPHSQQPVLTRGKKLADATGALILLHGRGASAEDILALGGELEQPGTIYLAPQAAQHTWYPNSFLAPIESNEPWLSSALDLVRTIVERVAQAGISREKIALVGFSQGACLATEFVARHAARYAGLVTFTGGLIGPEGTAFRHSGNLGGTPCFLGSGDPDPHVPWQRVQESAAELSKLGGNVVLKRYPGMPHMVSADEISEARALLSESFATTRKASSS